MVPALRTPKVLDISSRSRRSISSGGVLRRYEDVGYVCSIPPSCIFEGTSGSAQCKRPVKGGSCRMAHEGESRDAWNSTKYPTRTKRGVDRAWGVADWGGGPSVMVVIGVAASPSNVRKDHTGPRRTPIFGWSRRA